MVLFDFLLGLKGGVLSLQGTPIIAAYLSFVILSPVWRRFVPAVDIRTAMVVYNFICAIASLISVVYFTIALIPEWPSSLFDSTYNVYAEKGLYVFWLTKILELLDTVIMILRHRTRQVSFLHVFHHSSMALMSEYGYRRGPWSSVGVLLGLNALIHVFLYYYYGETARRKGMRPIWKKALTELQITQFVIGVIHQLVGYLYYNFCLYALFYEISMIVLFSNFYYHAYLKNRTEKVEKKAE